MAAICGHGTEYLVHHVQCIAYEPKNPIVPPVLVRKPAAPLVCVPSAFWTALTRAPTPAAWMPTADAYCSDGLGSYAACSGFAGGVLVARASAMTEGEAGGSRVFEVRGVGRGCLRRRHLRWLMRPASSLGQSLAHLSSSSAPTPTHSFLTSTHPTLSTTLSATNPRS